MCGVPIGLAQPLLVDLEKDGRSCAVVVQATHVVLRRDGGKTENVRVDQCQRANPVSTGSRFGKRGRFYNGL